ncbi:hypothetical protein AB1Y20_014791 [Prymnesium parvum]|uniref:Uncharacterized protein n=1 Tax=Prymnesium parvum TaxID=97485 RepID=A0AB34IF35_PRYPA
MEEERGVSVLEKVGQGHCEADGTLQLGTLLKWMDLTACLAAEKHCRANCVTLSMDEVHFPSDHPLRAGHVVSLHGQVNNAFNTSMEVGVTVRSESAAAAGRPTVCLAFFIFVALDASGKKLPVPPVRPDSFDERLEFALAAERRKVRLKRKLLEQEVLRASFRARCASFDARTPPHRALPSARAPREPLLSASSTQIVLPHHANHHGNTFGGQIMAWMVELAGVLAGRQARAAALPHHAALPLALHVEAIDGLQFLAPSRAGDRIHLRADVNRVFSRSMELSLTVQAYDVSGENVRHINAGFLVVEALGPDGTPLDLRPSTPPDASVNPDGAVRHEGAHSRRLLRSLRTQMRSLHAGAMTWAESLVEEMCISNVWGVLRLHHAPHWTELHPPLAPLAPPHVRVEACAHAWGLPLLAFRLTMAVKAAADEAFALLTSVARRGEWDVLFRDGRVVRTLDEANVITHQVFEPLSSAADRPHDYALLTSWRRESEGSYAIASRSIVIDEVPVQPQYQRGEVLPSGWLIEPHDGSSDEADEKTVITYVIQMKADLLGVEVNLESARRVAHILLPSILSLHAALDGPAAAGGSAPAAEGAGAEAGGDEGAIGTRKQKFRSIRERLRAMLSASS